MPELKAGKFTLEHADFQAKMRLRPNCTPMLVCKLKLAADPSNRAGLEELRDKSGAGTIIELKGLDRLAWIVTRLAEMVALPQKLSGGSDLPRWPVVDAWSYCLRLLPSLRRTEVEAQGKVYKSADDVALREAAVADLNRERKLHPAPHAVLPPNYFDLWA